jgi:hypothetical protein
MRCSGSGGPIRVGSGHDAIIGEGGLVRAESGKRVAMVGDIEGGRRFSAASCNLI